MSMDHKAFVFCTEKFHAEIEPVMKDSVNNPEVARRYICEHIDELQSPYTGDYLDENWEEEFDDLTHQVYFDILLTACYSVDEDCGLADMWDPVNDVVQSLGVFSEDENPLLGREVVVGGVTVDPGMQGLGIVESKDVAGVLERLLENRDDAECVEPDELGDDYDPEEWMEAYDNLCSLYEDALQQKKGLLFTF